VVARGKFITFEGGEGTGKSTQVRRLVEELREAGIDALATREPGGAPGAEEIRRLLVTGAVKRWDATTEALLHYAARREHLKATVLPALDAGRWVVSDRFADSTLAYQGYGHGVDLETLHALYRIVVGDFAPDLTIVLDVPVAKGLGRATAGERGEDRYERMDGGFHERLRQGFLAIGKAEPGRCVVIDGNGAVDAVAASVRAVVRARLKAPLP
jgi:dTMP kinase